jgi:hypothetical protein
MQKSEKFQENVLDVMRVTTLALSDLHKVTGSKDPNHGVENMRALESARDYLRASLEKLEETFPRQ